MNRNHLALFHAVARAGGISRGAELARVSQPAVSKQIKELEEALGIRLLERLPRGTRLTDGGRLLADYAQRLAALEQEAARAVEEFRGLKRGRLAIGASTTIGAYLLPQALGEFHRRHPDLELQLEIANTQAIQRLLLAGTVELGLTEGLMEAEPLDSKIFHEDELVAIAPRGHRLLKRKHVTVRNLCHEPFVMREEGSGTRAVVELALRKRRLSVKPVLSLAGTEAVKHAVIAGIGLAIVSRLAIGGELQSGSLAVIPVADLNIRRPLHLQTLRGRPPGPAAARFLTILASQKPPAGR
ncbi:MAG TPA: LysR family transcriptional regulator [Verrucomicrobiae bacterium]|nr:LysR family transcriptional regulator [Verrucomicrobiae bacterium]